MLVFQKSRSLRSLTLRIETASKTPAHCSCSRQLEPSKMRGFFWLFALMHLMKWLCVLRSSVIKLLS